MIGLNIVGGTVHDKAEWATRLQQDADWVAEQFARHKSDARAAVLLAQAAPAGAHELFFKQLTKSCQDGSSRFCICMRMVMFGKLRKHGELLICGECKPIR